MVMQMPPEELRKLRAWALEITIARHGEQNLSPTKLTNEAKKLVEFVRSDP